MVKPYKLTKKSGDKIANSFIERLNFEDRCIYNTKFLEPVVVGGKTYCHKEPFPRKAAIEGDTNKNEKENLVKIDIYVQDKKSVDASKNLYMWIEGDSRVFRIFHCLQDQVYKHPRLKNSFCKLFRDLFKNLYISEITLTYGNDRGMPDVTKVFTLKDLPWTSTVKITMHSPHYNVQECIGFLAKHLGVTIDHPNFYDYLSDLSKKEKENKKEE